MAKKLDWFIDYCSSKVFNVVYDGKEVEDIQSLNILFVNTTCEFRDVKEIGLIINQNEAFVLEYVDKSKGRKNNLFLRPYISDLHHHNLGCCLIKQANKDELKLIGKAWHIYLKELTKAREKGPSNCTFIASLLIPYTHLQKRLYLNFLQKEYNYYCGY